MKKNSNKSIASNIVGLIVTFLFMAAAAIMQTGNFLGDPILPQNDTNAISISSNGDAIINTTEIGKDFIGYAGTVPVEITISKDKISKITPLENVETPRFFNSVIESNILDNWVGLSPKEALNKKVDAVSGATYSSNALIANIQAGLRMYTDTDIPAITPQKERDIYFYCALIVIIAAMIIPLFWKNQKYRIIQQLLNVGVLGFWTGTFVNYTMLLGVMSNGLGITASIIPLLLLIVVFIYPLFGKNGYYCANVCPLGSIQELAMRCNTKHRIQLPPQIISILTTFRMILWGILMICLWTGAWMGWIDYELFTAFLVESASTAIIIIGVLVVILSIFIPRPYCRFICPTGTLVRISQNIETK